MGGGSGTGESRFIMSFEYHFARLKEAASQNAGKVVVLRGLERHAAVALVGDEACKRGEYTYAGPLSPIAPGVSRDSDKTYSVYVVKPIIIGDI